MTHEPFPYRQWIIAGVALTLALLAGRVAFLHGITLVGGLLALCSLSVLHGLSNRAASNAFNKRVDGLAGGLLAASTLSICAVLVTCAFVLDIKL